FGALKGESGRSWLLPNGAAAEETGNRRSDLILVWSSDAIVPLSEQRIRDRWPGCGRIRALGGNLYVVEGFAAEVAPEPSPSTAASSGLPPEQTREESERLLGDAKASGDRKREALAHIDLGLALKRHDDRVRGVGVLEQALVLAKQ